MSVTARSMIIALLLFVAAALFYQYSKHTGQISYEEIRAKYPTFEAENFAGTLYSSTGKKQYALAGEKITYYQSKGRVDVIKPEGVWFPENDAHWYISAEHGTVLHDKETVLDGNVVMQPADPDAEIREIRTPHMRYDMQQNKISSDHEITISGRSFIDRGGSYEADLNKKTIVIKDQPHAIYYPATQSRP